jgi:NAD(P) transhydrogenase
LIDQTTTQADAIPPAYHYDLVVMGSGPAGEKGAAQAAYFGKRVAIVEKEPHFGGAAANTGTLPSKTLRETALYLSGFRQRGLYGIEANLRERATVQDFLRRERMVKEGERLRIARNFERHKIDVFRGTAGFVNPHVISVEGTENHLLYADTVLIATGSRPYRPPIFPFEEQGVYDSDEILDLENFPSTMLVAGGGVIGCEYACIFAALGVQVTLVEARDKILSFLDDEVSAKLKERMEALCIGFCMADSVAEVLPHDQTDLYHVRMNSGRTLVTETIMVASGRSGNTEALNLPSVGITMNARGQIIVNEHYQTAVPHIYAAGDVIGFPALASASMEQGRLAMCHAFGLDYKSRLASILPYGIYTIPEVSAAGETEEDAARKGIDAVVGKANFAQNARGEIIGEEHGFLKLVFNREDMRLIGTHVIGEQATELVHIGLTAMLAGAGADLFIQTCFNYPTLAEAYKYATYDAMGKRARLQKTG